MSDSAGVLGDGAEHAGKYNMALARRAISNGWPISPEVRQLVVEQMALIVECSPKARNQMAAAKVLIAADALNARREATAEVLIAADALNARREATAEAPVQPSGVNVQVNGNVNIGGDGGPEELRAIAAQLRQLASQEDGGGQPGSGGGDLGVIDQPAALDPVTGSAGGGHPMPG